MCVSYCNYVDIGLSLMTAYTFSFAETFVIDLHHHPAAIFTHIYLLSVIILPLPSPEAEKATKTSLHITQGVAYSVLDAAARISVLGQASIFSRNS